VTVANTTIRLAADLDSLKVSQTNGTMNHQKRRLLLEIKQETDQTGRKKQTIAKKPNKNARKTGKKI
jgi:hypothetical protein